MKGIFIFSLVIMILAFNACGPSQSRQEKRIGINGEAVYVFNKDGSLKSIFKEKYSIHDFTVFIRRDTLTVGDTFSSSILVTAPVYRIVIETPSTKEILSTKTQGVAKYEFLPEKEGVYDYKGTIEFDSTSAEFEYKFIVVN